MQQRMLFHSTNNRDLKVSFEEALMQGQAPDYGLYMVDREDVPVFSSHQLEWMKERSYADIAETVLRPYVYPDIDACSLGDIIHDAYNPEVIPVPVQHAARGAYILWLTKGPTYSFKDFAARFYARALNYFLGKRQQRKTILVSTSGDTGPAVANAVRGLENIDLVVFYPAKDISPGQERQMTTLKKNVYAVALEQGDFNICQEISKRMLRDKGFAESVFGDKDAFTSANSISVGRLLPQMVYPFYGWSRMNIYTTIVCSIPSGNFGDMMGTVLAKHMGLPIDVIVTALNENVEFKRFLETHGRYVVHKTVECPSSAMMVNHPSNLARLVDFYGGHMHDERDKQGRIVREGVVDNSTIRKAMEVMSADVDAESVSNAETYETMKDVHKRLGILLDPHGAVGWAAMEKRCRAPTLVYETADPGKFPDDVEKATGVRPPLPPGMAKQATLPQRRWHIESAPKVVEEDGTQKIVLSDEQYAEAQALVRTMFKRRKAFKKKDEEVPF
jgi:threonine synthase